MKIQSPNSSRALFLFKMLLNVLGCRQALQCSRHLKEKILWHSVACTVAVRSLAVVQCTSMVALAPNTSETSPWDVLDTFPKLHSRAREAITGSCTEAPHSKSRNGIEIWQLIYEGCDGLEFFTRDPIGYRAGDENIYRFLFDDPLMGLDPTGLKCTYWFFLTDYFNLKNRLDLPTVKPEFDKCDRVAPICCWISDGKKVCREKYPDVKNPIVPTWPSRDNEPLVLDDDWPFIVKAFKELMPGEMNSACIGRNKCDCGDTFKSRIVCDDLGRKVAEKLVEDGHLPNNPCGKTYEWDCKNKKWTNPDGTPSVPSPVK